MTNKIETSKYIKQFIAYQNPILEKIETVQNASKDIQPNIGLQVGTFLDWLIHLTQAKRILEIGTCIGYSAIFLAEALRTTGGKLISIEQNPELIAEAKKNLAATNLIDLVELKCGNASLIIKELEGEFDLILQDSQKSLYSQMLDDCIAKLRPFGILVADDTLFYPMGIPEKHSKPMDEYNKKVFADPRLKSTILPIGDGITISIKLEK
jgi:caffeoyl-CoA O-methyltransferase